MDEAMTALAPLCSEQGRAHPLILFIPSFFSFLFGRGKLSSVLMNDKVGSSYCIYKSPKVRHKEIRSIWLSYP